ncbi:MAG: DNA repair protein RecO, partial [Gammaproteobacteria bacterium]
LEATGPGYVFDGERLFCALYCNELIARFLPRGDADEQVFVAYESVLEGLRREAPLEHCLRRFEVTLLQACGFSMVLEYAVDSDAPIDSRLRYFYLPESGPVIERPAGACREISGATLLALAQQLPWAEDSSREAKHLMRFVIQHHLGGRQLHSRTLFKYSTSPDTND